LLLIGDFNANDSIALPLGINFRVVVVIFANDYTGTLSLEILWCALFFPFLPARFSVCVSDLNDSTGALSQEMLQCALCV
jgi:hypothetical protein